MSPKDAYHYNVFVTKQKFSSSSILRGGSSPSSKRRSVTTSLQVLDYVRFDFSVSLAAILTFFA